MNIPFSKPRIYPSGIESLLTCINGGKWSGDGPFGKLCEAQIKDIAAAPHALITSSCTHALEMAFHLLKDDSRKEVLLPSFTFSSTANAVVLAGLKPIFCDIDEATMNISANDIQRKISKNTLAILPVHYAGVSCDMEKILELARLHKCYVVEDSAHAIGAKYKGKPVGCTGDMSSFSFHDTKNIACGEGGAFLTNSSDFYEKALMFREKGTNRSQFLRGLVDKYTWVSEGSSYVMAEPLAAILHSQLQNITEINQDRGRCYQLYRKELQDLHDQGRITLPTIPKDCETNNHLFHMLLPSEKDRNSLLSFLHSKKIGATFHYIPLHSSPQGKKVGGDQFQLPVTDSASARLIRLPLYADLSDSDLATVVSATYDWSKSL